MEYKDWKSVLKNEHLPLACIDLDAFDRNLNRIKKILSKAKTEGRKEPLTARLATKSIRVPELMKRILDSGLPYKGLMCFSAEEIEFLSAQGFDDFLLAYPTLQVSDLEALKRVHEKGKKVRMVVDSLESLKTISQVMDKTENPFELVVEVDMSLRLWKGRIHLGVRRSPVRRVKQVVEFFKASNIYPNLRIVGIMAYEAQVAGLGDRNPFKKLLNPIAHLIRTLSMKHVAEFRKKIAKMLEYKGFTIEIFNGGGSGNLNFAMNEPWLTEVTVGSGLMCPHLFDYYSNIEFKPAVFFALQGVRSSDPGYVTCQGGGYVASGEAGRDRLPIPYLPVGLKLLMTEGCGEVQTPLKCPSGVALNPGDFVLFRHAKAGELAEHFYDYLLIGNGQIIGRAKTYRGFGECYF